MAIAFDPESAPLEVLLGQSCQDVRDETSNVRDARPRDGCLAGAAEANLPVLEVESDESDHLISTALERATEIVPTA